MLLLRQIEYLYPRYYGGEARVLGQSKSQARFRIMATDEVKSQGRFGIEAVSENKSQGRFGILATSEKKHQTLFDIWNAEEVSN